MTDWTLTLGITPRSYNGSRYQHWTTTRREHQTLSKHIMLALIEAQVPRKPVPRIEATAVLRFPTRRRRDTGNFRTPLEKALGDCLQEFGTLADDTPDQYEFGWLRFTESTGPNQTLIYLTATPTLKDTNDRLQDTTSTDSGTRH